MEENNVRPKDFFKQLKSKEQFHELFQERFKQGVNECFRMSWMLIWGIRNMLMRGAISTIPATTLAVKCEE